MGKDETQGAGRRTKKPRPRVLVWLDRLAIVAMAVGTVMPGGLLDHWPVARWRLLEDAAVWPTVDSRDLHIVLEAPGGFAAGCRLELSDVTASPFLLLLNETFDVTRVHAAARTDAGQPVDLGADATGLYGTFERYHREAQALRIDLDRLPDDGRLVLELDYEGAAAHGPDGPDWRGIVLVDETEVRMCEQSAFEPQVPSAWQTPGVRGARGTLSVDAPGDWELFAPGRRLARLDVLDDLGADDLPADLADARRDTMAGQARIPPRGNRFWRWSLEGPGTFALVGGERVRHETQAGDARLVTLLRDEHAGLAEPFLAEARSALDTYTALWGPAGAGSLGIFEQVCRPSSSYNWAANGVIVFDRWALGDKVPLDTLGHETGHLWWGQLVEGRGDGERVLTEGLAEYASWRWLAERDEIALGRSLRTARGSRERLLENDRDAALRGVTFRSSGYNDLAYGKAPLVYRWIEQILGADVVDERLRAYAARHGGSTASLDELLELLGEEARTAPWFDHAGDVRARLVEARWTPDDPTREEGSGTLELELETELLGGAGDEFLDLLVPLRVIDREGASHAHVIGLRGSPRLALASAPAAAWLDPDGALPLPASGLHVFDGARLLSTSPDLEDFVPHGLEELMLIFDRPVVVPDDPEVLGARLAIGEPRRSLAVRAARLEDDGRRLVLTHRPLSPNRHYTLAVGRAVTDARGVPAGGDLLVRTAPSDDVTGPRVVSTTPPQGGTVPPDATHVTLVFDEVMARATGFKTYDIERVQAAGMLYPDIDWPRWSDDQLTLTVPFEEPLEPGRTYCLPFGPQTWRDLSDNGLQPFDFTFTVDAP